MFVGFFYLLRAHGFGVTLSEWMTLLGALAQNLHHTSLTGFYQLCRAVLVHSEADYDKFDRVFLEYFDGVPFTDDLPDELLRWLDHPERALDDLRAVLQTQGYDGKSIDEILKMFEERLKEQKEEHNGGSYWIGTGGFSNFGHSGHASQGIRVGDVSRHRLAARSRSRGSGASAISARTTCLTRASSSWRSGSCGSTPTRRSATRPSSTWTARSATPATTRAR